ncbi:MAG: DUF4349 domain-containing protein [Candidatus Omnitrophota bacterium]
MNINHVQKDLSSYLDNQVSDKRRLEIENHLKDCPLCSEELLKLKALTQKLKAWQAPTLGPDFDNSVRNKIVLGELERSEVKMKKKTLAVLIPSGVLAGILIIAFLFTQTYVRRAVQGRLSGTGDDISGLGGSKLASTRGYTGKDHYGDIDNTRYNEEKEGLKITEIFSQKGEPYRKIAKSAPDSAVRSGAEYNGEIEPPPTGGSVIVIQPVLPATGQGEMIIRTANVMLEVEDGKEAYKKASSLCQELGGYLSSSNFYKDAEGREAGSITMRIPKDKFLTALDRLSTLGKIENINSNSQDVSQEYGHLKSQLDTAMIVYNKMLEALQRRQVTISEAMRLESELTPVRQRIENLKNKIEALNNAVSFTTITLNFHEPRVSAKVLQESGQSIRESLITAKINAVKFVASLIKAIPALIVVGFWFLLALGVILLVKYAIVKIFRRG